jgi:hypothetical protein
MKFGFLDLKRPQYPASTELLLSSLAWAVIPRKPETAETGLMYERTRSPAGFTVKTTRPATSVGMSEFVSALESNGLRTLNGTLTTEIGKVILDALCGVSPEKGVGRASSSMGLAGALLQDARGALGVANPPNFANLINTIYALGGPPTEGRTAASAWFEAAHEYSKDPLLHSIEAAFVHTSLRPYLSETLVESWPPPRPEVLPGARPTPAPDWWQHEVVEPGLSTPFSWFWHSWNRLCEPTWVSRLTPRRWATWAICVTRHALAFTFLWESNFFEELARGALNFQLSPDEVARRAVVPVQPLIPHPQGSVSEMDVMPGINRSLTIGLACRNAVIRLTDRCAADASSLSELVLGLREHCKREAEDSELLMRALRGDGQTGGLPNLKETVRYSLQAKRPVSNGEEDNYGLLRVVSRRFVHVSPGPEWIVVMAAVSSESGLDEVRLGDVLQSMKALSFQPRIGFVLSELEKAGLCASASDGDEGIQVNLGFGRG